MQEFSVLWNDYGILGIILVLILTGQLVPRAYYNKIIQDNEELKTRLTRSMELNKIQSETINDYKQSRPKQITGGDETNV